MEAPIRASPRKRSRPGPFPAGLRRPDSSLAPPPPPPLAMPARLLLLDTTQQQQPYIAYNCLLIPVALGAWWYWTRRVVRKARDVVVEGLLPHRRDESRDDPQQQQQQHTGQQQQEKHDKVDHSVDEPSKTVRLVRWFKSRGKNYRAHCQVRGATLDNLRKGPTGETPLDDLESAQYQRHSENGEESNAACFRLECPQLVGG